MMVFLPWSRPCPPCATSWPGIRQTGRKGRHGFLAASLGLIAWGLLPLCFELPTSLESNPGRSPRILDRSGVVLDDAPRADFFRHQPVSAEDIPSALLDA
ncbi:MAG: hypothetical protein VYA27_01770, partial [Verrucomicrobiota bacterium]|nr:hypothetical protein [Verrucomicrobiota bacterium]